MRKRAFRLLPVLVLLAGVTAIRATMAAALPDSVSGDQVATNPSTLGRQIFAEGELRHNSNYEDFEVSLRMILKSPSGRETLRDLRIRQLEVPDAGDKVLVVFDKPANIRGTALLTHTHITREDDQWLFLPALKRTKKIAQRNKSGPFVGSEFSYEDLAVPELDKYDYRYLREDQLEGHPVHVVERRSRDEYSGYAREVFWIDQDNYTWLKVEYFDKDDGKAIKVLHLSNYQSYGEQRRKPHLMAMHNLESGKSTELHWDQYLFSRGFSADRDFSVSSLRRAR